MTPKELLSLLETIRNLLYILNQFLEPTANRWPLPANLKMGAGTAGCIVANRLSEDDSVNVLLIEAGGPAPQESVLKVIAIDEDDNELVFYANNEVILSAGALNTPKLLMLSGIGPKEVLDRFDIKVASDLPVGWNLMDHPGVMVVHKMGSSNATHLPINPTTFGPPALLGAVSYKNSTSYPDYQTTSLILQPNSDELFILCDVLFSLEVEFCEILREINKNNLLLITYLDFFHPRSRGKVEIVSRDPKVPPVVNLGQFSDENDLNDTTESIIHFLKVKDSIFFKEAYAETVDFKFKGCKDLKGFEYWKCYSLNVGSTLWHYSGTASLGYVVDNELKVIGVNKLRVADGSVIPIINTGNLNSPIMGIAEKAADLIKRTRGFDLIK